MLLKDLDNYNSNIENICTRLVVNGFYLTNNFYKINNKIVKFIYHTSNEKNIFVDGNEYKGNYIQENDELLKYVYQVESIEDIEKFDKIINMILLNKKEI